MELKFKAHYCLHIGLNISFIFLLPSFLSTRFFQLFLKFLFIVANQEVINTNG